jgi:CheY-like chemotaxis protein
VVTAAGGPGEASEHKLLIIENDSQHARTLMDAAHRFGFTGLLASRGANALAMVRETMPDAILLNVHLPDGDGWGVLDRIKLDVATRHIPVYLIASDEEEQWGGNKRACQTLRKSFSDQELNQFFDRMKRFIERTASHVLLLEPDPTRKNQLEEWIAVNGVEIARADSFSDAQQHVKNQPVDCLILNPELADQEGWASLESLARQPDGTSVPVIVYASQELTEHQENAIQSLPDTLTVRVVYSVEGLLDETTLILHQNVADLPEAQNRMLQHLHQASLEDKKVLIVDDDIRNIFAMTSVLEMFKMQVISEENGQDAINRLRQETDIDVILMDIMLPSMDGYDTIKAIRDLSGYESLPIIAITAKAMKADREKCLEAGASDYIPKPVDSELLRSILHSWLQR